MLLFSRSSAAAVSDRCLECADGASGAVGTASAPSDAAELIDPTEGESCIVVAQRGAQEGREARAIAGEEVKCRFRLYLKTAQEKPALVSSWTAVPAADRAGPPMEEKERRSRALSVHSPLVQGGEAGMADAGGRGRWPWKVLLAWQALALFITATGIFSQLLADRGVNAPAAQSLCMYVVLSSLLLVPRPAASGVDSAASSSSPSSAAAAAPLAPWWHYLLAAVADVEGNYFVVRAYQYTSITSVQLLDSFAIPCVMFMSIAFLGARYGRRHVAGAAVCLVGLALLVLSDVLAHRYGDDAGRAPNRPLGDALVLLGCVFYAASNIAQQHLVRAHDWGAFAGRLGAFGALVSGVQAAALEHRQLAAVPWGKPRVWAYLAGYVASLLALYVTVPVLLQRSTAVVMNLSFLTADFWSVVAAVLLFSAVLHPLYFVAFAVVLAGLVLFHWEGDGGGGGGGVVEEEQVGPLLSADSLVAKAQDGAEERT